MSYRLRLVWIFTLTLTMVGVLCALGGGFALAWRDARDEHDAAVRAYSAQADLAAKRLQLPALSDRVDRTTIRAPMSGKVNRVLVTTVGGSVSAGMPIAEIVPSNDALSIEAMIRQRSCRSLALDHLAKGGRVPGTANVRPCMGRPPILDEAETVRDRRKVRIPQRSVVR